MMSDLVARTPDASAWLERTLAAQEAKGIFGQFRPAVIWTDATGEDGAPLLALNPAALVAQINAERFPLQVGHDPGRPMGAMVAAEVFTSPEGECFVAAILGFYDGAPRIAFRDIGFDQLAPAAPPQWLPALPHDVGIGFGVDPRQVDAAWLNDLIDDAPVPVVFDARSYNAAEPSYQIVTVAVAFLLLVWNPFSNAVFEAMGKDAYAAVHAWLRRLLDRVTRLQDPILEIQSTQHACDVSYMIRGRDVAQNYKAHDALSEAAQRAARLIDHMIAADLAPKRLVYEFDTASGVWFPAFAELVDGRLMTDNAELIAAEHIPMGLSLGVSVKSLQELPEA